MSPRQTRTSPVDLGRVQRGWDVYAADGEKVGDVEEIHGHYLTVSKGWFFTTERYVPSSAISSVDRERVTLGVTKDQLDAQDWDRVPTQAIETGPEPTHRTMMAGDTERIPLREEELVADKRSVEAGKVDVRKEVVTEQRTVDVPVSREEVVVERHPVSRSEAADTDRGELGEGETIRMPIHEEQVSLEKTPVVTEEVEVGKRTVQETERVEGTVRREDVSIEHDEDVPVRHRQADVPHTDRPRRS